MTKGCCICSVIAAWVRRNQFAGDHYFCEVHAAQEPDFGPNSSSSNYFWEDVKEVKSTYKPITSQLLRSQLLAAAMDRTRTDEDHVAALSDAGILMLRAVLRDLDNAEEALSRANVVLGTVALKVRDGFVRVMDVERDRVEIVDLIEKTLHVG